MFEFGFMRLPLLFSYLLLNVIIGLPTPEVHRKPFCAFHMDTHKYTVNQSGKRKD